MHLIKQRIALKDITDQSINTLEKEIDKMNVALPTLTNFIFPQALSTVSKCHIARTVCRRAERNLVTLEEIEKINPIHLKYLNRLSDYLFILARSILNENNISHIEWQKKFINTLLNG